MTPTHHPTNPNETHLIHRLLDTFLREDIGNIRTASTLENHHDGPWLRRTLTPTTDLLIPVQPTQFMCQWHTRPIHPRIDPGPHITTYPHLLTTITPLLDNDTRNGLTTLATECAHHLTTTHIHDTTQHTLHHHLTTTHGPDTSTWYGPHASLAFDALAARTEHPVYPTSHARTGLNPHDIHKYAPETAPHIHLRWLALPTETLTTHPGTTTPTRTDIPGLAPHETALPIHPLTIGPHLTNALTTTGLATTAHLLHTPGPETIPTLSLRTLALTTNPLTHLKLPITTATLGNRNTRTITPGSLIDTATGHQLIQHIATTTNNHHILHADEQSYAHANHPLLACLARQLPTTITNSLVLPLAALTATTPTGRLVIDDLADRHTNGNHTTLLTTLWDTLLTWHITLLDHGIALESHQQNISLVIDPPSHTPHPPHTTLPSGHHIRLLYKDNDSPRIYTPQLHQHLTPPHHPTFNDPRINACTPHQLTDMFTTITLHLCCAAPAIHLEHTGHLTPGTSLPLLRERLEKATNTITNPHTQNLIRTHILNAPTHPIKAMLTAGTLLPKHRTRHHASDINKYYLPAPNYLTTS